MELGWPAGSRSAELVPTPVGRDRRAAVRALVVAAAMAAVALAALLHGQDAPAPAVTHVPVERPWTQGARRPGVFEAIESGNGHVDVVPYVVHYTVSP